jgi:hypothetical protein
MNQGVKSMNLYSAIKRNRRAGEIETFIIATVQMYIAYSSQRMKLRRIASASNALCSGQE